MAESIHYSMKSACMAHLLFQPSYTNTWLINYGNTWLQSTIVIVVISSLWFVGLFLARRLLTENFLYQFYAVLFKKGFFHSSNRMVEGDRVGEKETSCFIYFGFNESHCYGFTLNTTALWFWLWYLKHSSFGTVEWIVYLSREGVAKVYRPIPPSSMDPSFTPFCLITSYSS